MGIENEEGAETALEQDVVELERRRQQAELDKLRYVDIERRREIAHLDMLGEFGSKVG
jgi:hypothetical protein